MYSCFHIFQLAIASIIVVYLVFEYKERKNRISRSRNSAATTNNQQSENPAVDLKIKQKFQQPLNKAITKDQQLTQEAN